MPNIATNHAITYTNGAHTMLGKKPLMTFWLGSKLSLTKAFAGIRFKKSR